MTDDDDNTVSSDTPDPVILAAVDMNHASDLLNDAIEAHDEARGSAAPSATWDAVKAAIMVHDATVSDYATAVADHYIAQLTDILGDQSVSASGPIAN